VFNRKRREALERARARREREDGFARLRDAVPGLETLRLEVTVFEADRPIAEATHVRRVVVDNAPALFEIPCTDRLCEDGRHVLTEDVLRGLRTGRQRFEGAATCSGSGRNGSRGCTRVLRYVAIAGYREAR
jgi:hypothetical protein